MTTDLRDRAAMLAALLLGYGLMQMGNTLQGTLLSVRGGLAGFTPAEIGAVGAAFWAGVVLGSLQGGAVIARVGHIRTFAGLAAVAASAALLHLLLVDPVVWIAARALTGFCFAGLFMVVESWLNGLADARSRGRIMSWYGMTGLFAGIGGQMLLPVSDPAGYAPFCVVAMAIALALVPTALTRAAAAPAQEGHARISLARLYRQSPFGVVAAILCGVTTSSFFSLGPVFAARHGLDTAEIGLFMASGSLGGFLLTYPLGWFSDRLDRRLVIVAIALTASAALVAMIRFVPDASAHWVLLACAAVFGGTVIPTYSIVIAHVNDTVGQGEFVAASGGLLILQGVGATLGPVLAGYAMTRVPYGLSGTIILSQLAMAAWGLYRMLRRPVTADAARAPFVVEPPVPVGTELMPDGAAR